MTVTDGGYKFKGGEISGQNLLIDAPDGEVVINNQISFQRINSNSKSLEVKAGKLILNHTNNIINDATVQGGTLIVGEDETHSDAYLNINNTIDVANEGVLGGHGAIKGDVFIRSGGALSPGNS
ncbi:MAG: hypothetical protein LBV23_00500, partial [Deltaproteobacteria bacterium]|nr:hypothetical protein [Deltaproteobacteria bacterium]